MNKPGSFSAYLEYAQRDKPETSASRPSGSALVLTLLSSAEAGQMGLSDLAEATQMSAQDFNKALKQLSATGFIEISGERLNELVTLTAKGRDAATLL